MKVWIIFWKEGHLQSISTNLKGVILIISFLFQYPYSRVLILAFALGLIYFISSKRTYSYGHRWGLISYIALLVLIYLIPHSISHRDLSIPQILQDIELNPFLFLRYNMLSNLIIVVSFLPLPGLLFSVVKEKKKVLLYAVLIGFGIECIQLLLNILFHSPIFVVDVNDLVLYTLANFIGYSLFLLLQNRNISMPLGTQKA